MAQSARAPEGFDAALRAVEGVDGWMTDAQARRLYDAAAQVPAPGRIVEIGSFHGRSTIVLASAARPGVEVVAIDPHGGAWVGEEDFVRFHANLRRAGVAERVRHVRLRSQDALAHAGEPVDVLYVDGAHRYAPARADIERYGAKVRPGGVMLVHDAYSAIGVMLAQLRVLFAGGEFWYVGRSGSLAEYRREPLPRRARARNALRQAGELPYFGRNALIKAAMAAKRPGLARLLGHDGDHWPY